MTTYRVDPKAFSRTPSLFRDDAAGFLSQNCRFGTLEDIEFEHCIEGIGSWVFGYVTAGDFRVACVGRDRNDKPTILWDNPA